MLRKELANPFIWVLITTVLLAGCGSDTESDRRRADAKASRELASAGIEVADWKTDFSKHRVPLREFMSGGPPRDGIPPIDSPEFVSQKIGDSFLTSEDPVIAVEIGGRARAYPIQILVWHEIVNDTLSERPIIVTYCPLCNSALAFSREVKGRDLTFGTTGNLRRSDLVMWDRQTESWWQQIGGEAMVGELTGAKLRRIDSQVLSWRDFKLRYQSGAVLSRNTGYRRDYGKTPYQGYDSPESPPFGQGKPDERLPPKERVAAISRGEETVVIPFSALVKQPVIQTSVSGRPVVVFFKGGVRSVLDKTKIRDSRDTGTVGVFDRRLGSSTLTFKKRGKNFADLETGSSWDITGRAVSGRLKGNRLEQVSSDNHFWFAIAAFFKRPKIVRS